MRYAFIVNPASGADRGIHGLLDAIGNFCRRKSWDYVVRTIQGPGQARGLAERALKENFTCLVAVGGDGTINGVGSALVNKKIPLGLIPRGSGNGFAREFGVPLRVDEALESLAASEPLSVDAGETAGEVFFNVLGFGLDAEIAEAFEKKGKSGRRGLLPYFTTGAQKFLTYKPSLVSLKIDGGKWEGKPLIVAVANGSQYGGGARIAPEASATDGFFHVAVILPAPWVQLAWHIPRLFRGTLTKAPFLVVKKTKTLRAEFSEDTPYHIDGEVRRTKSLDVKIRPGALTLLAPPSRISRR